VQEKSKKIFFLQDRCGCLTLFDLSVIALIA
jgi:hypothetical protein